MSGHVFVDESKAKGYLLVASAVVPGELRAARVSVRSLLAPGQKRLHMKSEGDRRRKEVLASLTRLGVQADVMVADPSYQTDVRRRAACLRELVGMIAREGHSRLSLESDESQDPRDRQVIAGLVREFGCSPEFTYKHMRATEEPLLAIPDAIAWSYARGGDWRRRVEPLVRRVVRV